MKLEMALTGKIKVFGRISRGNPRRMVRVEDSAVLASVTSQVMSGAITAAAGRSTPDQNLFGLSAENRK